MTHPRGTLSGRIFDVLRDRILSGELAVGARLPPHTRLASDFGVAPMTIRTVLARLEEAGLVSRELGRGTYVRRAVRPAVLVLAASNLQALIAVHIRRQGFAPILIGGLEEGLSFLAADRSIGLVLCEISDPGSGEREAEDFIRTVRRRWPRLPVAAVTSSVANLAALLGTPESPVLVVSMPVRPSQLEEVLRLALPAASVIDPARVDLLHVRSGSNFEPSCSRQSSRRSSRPTCRLASCTGIEVPNGYTAGAPLR